MHLVSRKGSSTSNKSKSSSSRSMHMRRSKKKRGPSRNANNPLRSVAAGVHAKISMIKSHQFLSANKALFVSPPNESSSSKKTSSHSTEPFIAPKRQSLDKHHSSSSTSTLQKSRTKSQSTSEPFMPPKRQSLDKHHSSSSSSSKKKSRTQSTSEPFIPPNRKSIFFDKNAPTSSESESERESIEESLHSDSFSTSIARKKSKSSSIKSSIPVPSKAFRKSLFVSQSAEASSSENESIQKSNAKVSFEENTKSSKESREVNANPSTAFRKSLFQSQSARDSEASSDKFVSFNGIRKSARDTVIKEENVSTSMPMSSSISTSMSNVIQRKKLNRFSVNESSSSTQTASTLVNREHSESEDLQIKHPTNSEMNQLKMSIIYEKKLLEKERQNHKISLQNELKQLDEAHAADMRQKDDIIKELKQNAKENENDLVAKNAEIEELNERLMEYEKIEEKNEKNELKNEHLLRRKTMQVENEQSKVENLQMEKCDHLQKINKEHVTKLAAMKMMIKARNSKIKSGEMTIGIKDKMIRDVEEEIHEIDEEMHELRRENESLKTKIGEQNDKIIEKEQSLKECNDKLEEKELIINGLNDELKNNQKEVKKSSIIIQNLRADKSQMDEQKNEFKQMEMDKMKMEMNELRVLNTSYIQMVDALKKELIQRKNVTDELKKKLSEKDVNMNEMKMDFRKAVRMHKQNELKINAVNKANSALLKRIKDLDDARVENAQKVVVQMKEAAKRETNLIGGMEKLREEIHEKERMIVNKNDRLAEMEQTLSDQQSHFTNEMMKSKSYNIELSLDERTNNPQTVKALKKRIHELTESMNAMQRQNNEISKKLSGYIHEVNIEMASKNESKSQLNQLKKRFEKVITQSSAESITKDAMIQDLQNEIKEIGHVMGQLAEKLIGFDQLKHAHIELKKRYKKQTDNIRKLEYTLSDYVQKYNNACFENTELSKEVSMNESVIRSKDFEINNQNELIKVLRAETTKMRGKMNENNTLKSVLAKRDNEIEKFNVRMKQNENEIADLRSQINEKLMNLREMGDERESLLEKMEDQNMSIKLKQKRLNELIPRQRLLEKEVAYLQRAKEVNEDQIESLQSKLEQEIGRMTAEIDEKNIKMNELMQWNTKYKESQQNEVIEIQESMNEQTERYIAAFDEKLKTEMNKSQCAMEKMQDKIKQKNENLEKMTRKHSELMNKLAGQRLKTEMTDIELNDMKQELTQLVEERDRLKAETRKLQRQLTKLAT